MKIHKIVAISGGRMSAEHGNADILAMILPPPMQAVLFEIGKRDRQSLLGSALNIAIADEISTPHGKSGPALVPPENEFVASIEKVGDPNPSTGRTTVAFKIGAVALTISLSREDIQKLSAAAKSTFPLFKN